MINLLFVLLTRDVHTTRERSRHIKIRYFFIRHYIDMDEIIIEYMPTADIMTKPLHSDVFNKLANVLSGNKELNV